MGNQNNQKKWYDFIFRNIFTNISIAVMAVFDENAQVNVERPVFVDERDPARKKKVFLEGIEGNSNSEVRIIFSKLAGYNPMYHEINLRFPKDARIGRKSEAKAFDIRNKDQKFGYCFLRIQPEAFFEGVFVKVGKWNYKISVVENENSIEVVLWNNPTMPDCLR